MDSVKAAILFEKLKGKPVGNWEIQSLKNHGKSAAVFVGKNGGEIAAVKVFDEELIERYGDKTQIARIERELTLVGKSHPNMVRIIEGGVDTNTNSHFIVMEYLDGPNIKQCLADIPFENIGSLVGQLASAAEFLENEGLVHRDIKPENIVLLDGYKRLVLLDFGVIRFVGEPGLTDGDGIQPFIGTLQYSSPEFLLRQEEDTLEGWRALTFYQIGAVIHDLIMRKELFEEYANPFAKLVNAVQNATATIQSSDVEKYIIELARACLIKPPEARLKLLNWDSFRPPESSSAVEDNAKQRVTNRVILRRAEHVAPDAMPALSPVQVVNELVDVLKKAVRLLRTDNELFPFIDTVFRAKHRDRVVTRLRASKDHALPLALTILLDIEVVDAGSRAVTISLSAFWGNDNDNSDHSAPPFFKGSVDTTTIQSSLDSAVYSILDAAQAAENPVLGDWL